MSSGRFLAFLGEIFGMERCIREETLESCMMCCHEERTGRAHGGLGAASGRLDVAVVNIR